MESAAVVVPGVVGGPVRAERDGEVLRLLSSLRSRSVFAPNQPVDDVKTTYERLYVQKASWVATNTD